MKKNMMIYGILAGILFLCGCDENNYLKDLYVEPVAAFDVPKTQYDVFESVLFSNKGSGQYFALYPGDKGHQYGVTDNTGYSASADGTFSYSYRDPGTYTAVWVASSINEDGNREFAVDSMHITVLALDGGLDNLSIYNIYKMDEYSTGGLNVFYSSYGEFLSKDTLLCPILFASWRDATINSIKAKQLMKFQLSSSNAKMYWVNQGVETEIVSMVTSSRVVMFVEDGKLKVQNFRVKTVSGIAADYYAAPVMIPQFTQFSINGVNATITRNTSSYTLYDVALDLPSTTNMSNLVPTFTVMNNDVNLLDGTNCKVTVNEVEQVSGTTAVNFAQNSSNTVDYRIDYTMLGSNNQKLSQSAIMRVKITKK